MPKPVLHAITTGGKTVEDTADDAATISPFVDAIHIREHSKTAREIYELANRMIKHGVPSDKIIINNRVDAALAAGIERVQLGFHSLPVRAVRSAFPRLSIGKSVHSLEEALQAEREGADYILYGHVFETSSKTGLNPKGLNELNTFTAALTIPVLAIGGIKPDNLHKVIKAGVSGVAVMSGLFQTNKPAEAAIAYQNQLEMVFHE
jgi:thiazole tautomerase (transcriptional regulator TenI)